jgi:hypothetical protein
MNPTLHPSDRHCVVEKRKRFDLDAIRAEILRHENVCGEFTLPATPAPSRDQTLFKVYSNGTELIFTAALFESVAPSLRHASYKAEPLPNRNHIELYFAPWNDGIGVMQFCFPPDGALQTFSHLPYPEAHSTRFRRFAPKRFFWQQDKTCLSHRLYWFFAWFRVTDIFRNGPACGFNVGRQCPPIEESSSWNHAAAVGFQDATLFGTLHLRWPKRIVPFRFPSRPATKKQARDFRLSLTYDIPDNVGYTNYYTPQRLERELATLKSWGIQRIYWIEYGPLSSWPSLWDMMVRQNIGATTERNVALTRRYCDDMLPVAARYCHRLGMECYAVYKPFDLGFNTEWVKNDGVSCVKEIEDRMVCAHPDVAAHPEWTMRANPAWVRRACFPITRLSLFSEEPIGKFAAKDVTLWVSRNNRNYQRYRKPFRVVCGPVRRPHTRWTPAGIVTESGSATNWRIEVSGLQIEAPFVAIEIKGKSFPMRHRMFALAEARGADNSEAPVGLATSGNRVKGFRFNKSWLGWANHDEPILDVFTWNGPELGLVFREADHASTLLEPAFPGARGIWLKHVERILKAGVDGVDIRTIGHHNIVPSYLQLAYAEPVRVEFRRRFGREVEATPGDYERVRRIRGEAYTQFMRDARALANRYGRKLAAHIEWGADVPAHLDTRLQLQMVVEWQRWIRERLVDEVSLRGWACWNRYVHRHLLPLAHRHGVGVHIITKNLPGGLDLRAMELCERFVKEACRAGFSGYNFYEADNLLRMNAEGIPMSIGNTESAVRNAARSLARMT